VSPRSSSLSSSAVYLHHHHHHHHQHQHHTSHWCVAPCISLRHSAPSRSSSGTSSIHVAMPSWFTSLVIVAGYRPARITSFSPITPVPACFIDPNPARHNPAISRIPNSLSTSVTVEDIWPDCGPSSNLM